jgi:RHS repeat-associated protein
MPTTLEQIQYGFDRNSRRTWQKRPLTDTQDQQYGYDALSQVSAATRGSLNLNKTAICGRPASAEIWDYDPTGNWRSYHTAAAGTSTLDQHRVHDRGNRLTQIEDNPHNMILDRVGRMRQMVPDAEGDWDGKLELTWDGWSRITSVKNNGEVVGEYAYDGTHRRVTREVDGETLHSYYNDAWRPVEERKDAETTAASSYLWGARHRDDLVRRDRAVGGTTLNETRYVLMDYFNPAAITDECGVVKERYAFSAFGVRTILNPDFTTRSASECAMEFAFQGQFLDIESGLMNYGFRYYTPYLGRWTCKDPIKERGGINLYEIAANAPINGVDYLGLLYPPGTNWFPYMPPPDPRDPRFKPQPTPGCPDATPPVITNIRKVGTSDVQVCCKDGKVIGVIAKLTDERGSGTINKEGHTIILQPGTSASVCCYDKKVTFEVNKSVLIDGSAVATYLVFDETGKLIGTDAKVFGSSWLGDWIARFAASQLEIDSEDIAKIKSTIESLNWLCK